VYGRLIFQVVCKDRFVTVKTMSSLTDVSNITCCPKIKQLLLRENEHLLCTFSASILHKERKARKRLREVRQRQQQAACAKPAAVSDRSSERGRDFYRCRLCGRDARRSNLFLCLLLNCDAVQNRSNGRR